MNARYLISRDGHRLYVQQIAPADTAIGRVLITHGLSEHAGRYQHVMQFMADRGFEVYAHDLRGHGHSGGLRGDVRSYDRLLDDLDLHLASGTAEKPLPLILYGHSLGGGIVGHWLTRRQHPYVAGGILSAPWFRLTQPISDWKILAIRAAARLCPTWRIAAAPPIEHLTGDPAAAQRYQEDPLFHRQISLRLAVQAYDAGRATLTAAQNCPLPVLTLHSPDDQVTDHRGSVEFCQQAPQAELQLYPGLAHELHNELNWRDILSPVATWMTARCRDFRPLD